MIWFSVPRFGFPPAPLPAEPPAEPPEEEPDAVPDPVRDEQERIMVWRRDVLEEVGLPYPLALEIAIDPRIDLHQVVQAVKDGATPELVQDIFL